MRGAVKNRPLEAHQEKRPVLHAHLPVAPTLVCVGKERGSSEKSKLLHSSQRRSLNTLIASIIQRAAGGHPLLVDSSRQPLALPRPPPASDVQFDVLENERFPPDSVSVE